MPGAQHRPHHHVHLAVCRFIQLLCHIQERYQLLIHRHRLSPRLLVDGAEVVDAGILMVDIEEHVVSLKNRIGFITVFYKLFLTVSSIGIYVGNSVEEVIVDSTHTFGVLDCLCLTFSFHSCLLLSHGVAWRQS